MYLYRTSNNKFEVINSKDQNMKSIDDISDPPISSGSKFWKLKNFWSIIYSKIYPKLTPKNWSHLGLVSYKDLEMDFKF